MLTITATPSHRPAPSPSQQAFEQIYRSNVDVIVRYFARRCQDPQTVADLTSETFVRAIEGFARFDPTRGSGRAWLFGIAHHVFTHHCRRSAIHRGAVGRLGGYRELDGDEFEELTDRIDAERDGAVLVARCAQLPANERAVIDLVDLEGLNAKEAATTLGISHVACRQRLSRARSRLRDAA